MGLKKILSSVGLGRNKDKLNSPTEGIKSTRVNKIVNTGRVKTDDIIKNKGEREIEMPAIYMEEAMGIKKDKIAPLDGIDAENEIQSALTSISTTKIEIPRQNIRRNVNALIDMIMKARVNYLGKNFETIIIDISKGGMRIFSNKVMEEDTEIDLNFNFVGIKCNPKGKIVSKKESENRPGYFTYSIKFLDLNENKGKELDNLLAKTKNVASNINF